MNNVKPALEQCELLSLKKSKDGIVKIQFGVQRSEGDHTFVDKNGYESAEYPHPDLNDTMNRLKPILAYSLGRRDFITVLENVPDEKLKASADKLLPIAKEAFKADLDKITIVAVTAAGVDDNKGLIISGKYESKNTQNVAMNSPRIKFSDESFGSYADELENIYDELEGEAYRYMYENKRAQLNIDFNEDNNEQQGAE